MAMISNIPENISTVYLYEISVNDITYERYYEICQWILDHNVENFSDYNDYGSGMMDTWWRFKCKDAATLFKLTWG